MATSIMIMGTASHVGKSTITTGLCRWLANRGYRVAPFKAQNMSLNSTVTPDGREIAWSQALQAEAARAVPSADMNPVLLKPTAPSRSQIVLQGRVLGDTEARDYFTADKTRLWRAVEESFQRLAGQFDVLVLEGAGSPVEMNLKRWDIANMRAAAMADAKVLLVADIERGGVFASLVGTWELLEPHERARVMGIIINKFRGDPDLFAEGRRWLETRLNLPVWGVVPYLAGIDLEEEDSLGLSTGREGRETGTASRALRIAVVRLPHVANFVDVDPLVRDPRVDVRWCERPAELGAVDAVILPGTKNTVDDLRWLHQTGWAVALRQTVSAGTWLLGICGGFQMMGHVVRDPDHVESRYEAVPGLGLTGHVTTLTRAKQTRQVTGRLCPPFAPDPVTGYEIHMGVTEALDDLAPLVHLGDRTDGIIVDNGRLIGTYVHGLLENPRFTEAWLERMAQAHGKPLPQPEHQVLSAAARRDRAYERLAQHLDRWLDLSRLEAWLPPPLPRGNAAARPQ